MPSWPPRLAEIPALVLAGGRGTRLRPVVADRPKVLAPVAGRPFLFWLLERIAAEGLSRAILCTGHMAEQVERALAEHEPPLEVTCSHEPRPLGTGGAIALARERFGLERALVLNGDTFTDAALPPLLRAAHDAAAPGALLAVRVAEAGRYGTLEADGGGRILRFREKGVRGPALVSAGVVLLGPEMLRSIPGGRAVSLEREVLPAWAGRGLLAVESGGRFVDIGTPESYRTAGALLAGAGAAR